MTYVTFRLLLASLFTITSFTFVPSSWAQMHHDHGHPPPEGAAHEHRFKDIDQAVKMFEGAERDAWQKPDEVVNTLHLRSGDVVVDIGAGTGYFTRRFAAAVGPQGKALGLDIEPTMGGSSGDELLLKCRITKSLERGKELGGAHRRPDSRQ